MDMSETSLQCCKLGAFAEGIQRMSGTPGPARPSPVAAIILSVVATFLYLFVLANTIALPGLESIDAAIAAIFGLAGIVLLWLVLAGLLLVGAAKGAMPQWAGATMFVAHPLSAAAAITALIVLSDHHGASSENILFVALPPPLLAGYALWAHFPRLHSSLPPTPTSAAVVGVLLVASLGQLAFTLEHNRERTVLAAQYAKESEAQYQKEEEAKRQANLARFQRLNASSPLSDWQEFIGKGNDLEKEALAIVSTAPRRQEDAEAMLQSGEPFPLYHISALDLTLTPKFCAGASDYLVKNATEHRPSEPDERYVLIASHFDSWLPTMAWMIDKKCDLGRAVAAMQDAVRAYPASPERDKALILLERLNPQWATCRGDNKATPDEQIAGCTGTLAGGALGKQNTAVALFHRGDAYMVKSDTAAAIRDYTDAVQAEPKFAEAYNNRGNAYDDSGDHQRAIRDYDEAIRNRAEFSEAINNRGTAYDEMGDHARAIQDFDEAIRLNPEYQNAFKNRGRAKFFQDKFSPSADDFAKALAMQRTDAYAALWLHLARGRSGKSSPDELRRNAKALDHAAWPWPLVAAYLGELDDAAVQRAANQDAAEAKDRMCEAALYLAENAMLRGGIPAARDMLQQAVTSCPQNSIEYYAARFELERARP
jgi:lipoprotein NlpI